MSHFVREAREDTGSQFCNVFTSILKSGCDFVTVAKRLEDNLLSESEFVDSTQELDIAEGDAYKSIKEVRVVAISGTSFDAVSREEPREIPIAMFGIAFEAVPQLKAEIELRIFEGNVKHHRAKWENYNRV